jgi:ribosomal protein S18 acetylase RimI-like enzyme
MKATEAVRLDWPRFPRAAEVLTRAFLDYPLMTYCTPHVGRRRRATASLYASVLRYTMRFGDVYTTPNGEGTASWLPPDRPLPTFWRMVRSGMYAVPFAFGWAGFQRLQAMDHVAEAEHRRHAPGPHWYLWVIGVAPEHQGKGIAGRLMRPVFEQADRDRYRCYLETHKESNVPVYERYGFRVVAKTPVPRHALTVWAMLRGPEAGSD